MQAIFLVHNLCCNKYNVSENIGVERLEYTSYEICLEFLILCSNRWLQIEVTARQKSVFPRYPVMESLVPRGQWRCGVTNRCAAGYQDNNPKKLVILLGSGAEGYSELRPVLQSDNVVYALLRVVGIQTKGRPCDIGKII